MKRFNSLFLTILMAALIIGPTWGQTVRYFPGPVKFGSTVTVGGVTYTFPSVDGTSGYQLTTNGSGTLSWAAAGAGAGNTLDQAYDQGGAGSGRTITVDQGAVQLNGSHATNDTFFINKTAGSGHNVQITNAGTGDDINGTAGTWYVSKAGAATFVSAIIPTLTTTTFVPTSIGAFTGTGAINLNDADGASPSFTFTDGTGETAVFSKADTGVLSLTTVAGDGFKLLTGNIWIGNGTPGTAAMNGEDLYVEGDVEIDGSVQLDGAVTGAAGLTVTGGVVNLNASSNNAVNIGTGTTTSTVTIGGSGAQSIAVGNGAAAKTVALGSTNTTSTTTISSGSGGVLINSSNNQPTTINGGTSTGTVTIGATTATVGVLGTYTTNYDAGASTTGIGTGSTTGTVTIGGTGAQAIDVGTGAAAKTVTVGSTNTTSTTAINSGSGGVGINVSNNQPTNIGTGTTTGTITIGGAGAQTINIGNGAAAKAVTLGSTNTTSATTINAGSGNITFGGNMVATGKTLTGALKTVTTDNNGSNLTSATCGTVQVCSGAGVTNLPEASTVIGCRITFVVGATANCDLNPDDADQILIATNAAGDAVRADAIGETISVIAIDATNWVVDGTPYGTWTDVD